MIALAQRLEPFRSDLALRVGLFLAATLLYAVPSLWLLDVYLQPPFDLAIYDQSLWLILHGETLNTVGAAHVFAGHFSPILFLLAPLALVPGGAVPELVIQSVTIASGVFPAARLATQLGRSRVGFMVAYALHPAIIGGSWFGFRPWNLAVPVFLWGVYILLRRPTALWLLVLGLAMLLFREDLAAWIGLVALVLALDHRFRWRDLLLPGLLLGALTALLLLKVIPAFSPIDSYFFTTEPQTRLPGIPFLLSSVAVRLVFLIMPLGIAPSRVRWKLTLPLLIPILGLIIKGGFALTTFFHYDMMFIPVLLLIVGLSPRASFQVPRVVMASLLVILSLGVLRPIAPHYGPNPFKFNAQAKGELDRVVEIIAAVDGHETLSVAAPARLLPHLSQRRNAFIFPSPLDADPRFVAGLQTVTGVEFRCPEPNIVVVDRRTPVERWPQVLAESYRSIGEAGNYSVFVRNEITPDQPCTAIWRTAR